MIDLQAQEAFYLESLAAAVAWCAPRAEPAQPESCLRSVELTPADSGLPNKSTVRDLVRKRAELLGSVPILDLDSTGSHSGGKVLLYEFFNFQDGASQVDSNGFFDIDELPPWDTWLDVITNDTEYSRFGTYLMAWIPQNMMAFAEAGIGVNPTDNIPYATERHSIFLDHLRARGLLL